MSAGRFVRGALLGAAAMYFFDPARGRSRRASTRDRTLGVARRAARRVARLWRGTRAQLYGWTQKAQHLREQPKPAPDDWTLAQKVETEIFRDPKVPKGQINVNAEHGVVYLRGEVPTTDLVEELERATRRVQGVADVHNLLHLPGEPAPGRAV